MISLLGYNRIPEHLVCLTGICKIDNIIKYPLFLCVGIFNLTFYLYKVNMTIFDLHLLNNKAHFNGS